MAVSVPCELESTSVGEATDNPTGKALVSAMAEVELLELEAVVVVVVVAAVAAWVVVVLTPVVTLLTTVEDNAPVGTKVLTTL